MNNKNDRVAWLQGGDAVCAVEPPAPKRTRRLILLGAPGVGKGTQAALLCARLGACHLSTGDVFRAAKCLAEGERSPALDRGLEQMRRGDLVSDDTVLAMVKERIRCLRCRGGFVLDGFPRTVVQAKALEEVLTIEKLELGAVLNYELPIEEIVSRLGGRRTCSQCKAVFHVKGMPPRVAGICDHCGGTLFQREDDAPDAIRIRMLAYERATLPLIDYYSLRGLLISVPAHGAPEQICQRALDTLKAASI